MDSFPTALSPNISATKARELAANPGVTFITVEQVHGESDGIFDPFDMSQRFSVFPSTVELYLDINDKISRDAEYQKWKLGVGIGVGLGVPVFIAATAVLVLYVWPKRLKKPVQKV